MRPWFGDLTGQRVERILDLIGWPEDLRDIDPGAVVCGNADIAGMTALDYLQVLAQTEQGRLFIAADGKLTFHALDRTLTGPSACTFTDDGTGAGIVEGSLTFTLDNTFVYDGAEVQRKYGPYQRAGAEHPTKVISLTGLASRDDRRARVLAERLVARYRTPRTRADAWTVQPQNDPSSWPAILALEIGDVVTLDATPQGVGDPITLDLFIEQINGKPTPSDWTITFQGSPVDDRDLFRFDGPNTDGARHGFNAGVFY